MFDEISCEYPLPDAIVQGKTFHTKSFDRMIPTENVEVPFHSDVYFCTSRSEPRPESSEWLEYQARFTDEKLQWIKRVEREQRR